MGSENVPEARLHMVISGTVQGVFFRASTREKALALGLTGWVKNLLSGEVECVAEGDRDPLDYFLQWIKRGPPGTTVNSVHETREDATGEFSGFEIRC
ncbi:MAG: acylphosphatase [Candidatus Micrarchaeota archaeon]